MIDHHFAGSNDFQITVGHDIDHPAGDESLKIAAAAGFTIPFKIALQIALDRWIAKRG